MVKTHVAGLTSAGVLSFRGVERVPGVARIALGIAIAVLFLFLFGFEANFVTARAPLIALANDRGRLVRPHGHGGGGDPCEVVLPLFELPRLLLVTGSAGFYRWHFRFR